jgi:hypothetical protein
MPADPSGGITLSPQGLVLSSSIVKATVAVGMDPPERRLCGRGLTAPSDKKSAFAVVSKAITAITRGPKQEAFNHRNLSAESTTESCQ